MTKAKVRLNLTLRKTIEIDIQNNLSEKERREFLVKVLNEMMENNDKRLELNEKEHKHHFSAKLESYPIWYNLDSKEF